MVIVAIQFPLLTHKAKLPGSLKRIVDAKLRKPGPAGRLGIITRHIPAGTFASQTREERGKHVADASLAKAWKCDGRRLRRTGRAGEGSAQVAPLQGDTRKVQVAVKPSSRGSGVFQAGPSIEFVKWER